MNTSISKFLFLLIIPGLLFSGSITATSMAKLSPDFQALVAKTNPENAHLTEVLASRVRTISGPLREVLYPVTIRSNDIDVVKAAGIQTNSDFPGFSTARITYDQLITLSELDVVSSVYQGDLLYALNDLAVSQSGADLVHDAYVNSTAYDGTDVIVVIIDTGIDWSHLDFRDPDTPATSRILRIWDQTLTAGGSELTPHGRDATNFNGLDYGVEYLKTDIEDEIDGSPAVFVRTKDTNGHGTEVASGAVGNGASLPSTKTYKGMAPNADIVIVRAGQSTTFDDADVKNALTYARKIANYYSPKPVVVNLSLGNQSHAHDGTASLDEAVDSFSSSAVADGKTNGRVAVIAAGNAGNEPIHVTGTVGALATESITITVPPFTPNSGSSNDVFQFELWWDQNVDISAVVKSPGNTYSYSRGHNEYGAVDTPHGAIALYNIGDADHSNGDLRTFVQIYDYTADQGPEVGDWTLEVTNNSGFTRTYHAWLYYSSMKSVSYPDGATVAGGDTTYTIASPGVASSAITVGAYSARWKWYSSADAAGYGFTGTDLSDDIAYFSSIGPTRDNRVKPEICVPGRGLFSATSADMSPAPATAKVVVTNKYHLTEGTSGASGVVSGAVALLLDYSPTMTATDVKNYIINNADDDSYTVSGTNATWGYGKLNIFESMADAVGGGTTLYHKTYAHDAWGSSESHGIDIGVKEGVKFTSSEAGEITGAFFFPGQIFPSSGNVSFEIWTNVSGLPSTKVGFTITMNCADIAKYTWNYVSLKNVGVNVLADENFHLVLNNTSGDTISLRKSTSSISYNSSTDLGVGWATLTDKDWRLRAVVSNNAEVTTSGLIDTSLPVDLTFFNAGTYKGQMVLKWATESETENQGFTIERRKNGTDEWKLIADHTKDPGLQGQGSTSSRTDYIYYDKTTKPGQTYDYRLTDIPYTSAYTPNSIILEEIEFRIGKFALHKNYPNPFNPATTISYELAENSDVQIKIVDVTGREVQSWRHDSKEAGYHEMIWAGVDQYGKPVSAGLYLLSVEAGNNFQTRKLLLLK